MCVWASSRGRPSPAPSLLLLLFLLPVCFQRAQAAIHIPKDYKVHNMSHPPTLTELPSSCTAFSQEDFTLSCEASGNPPPTFRWEKDGEAFGAELHGSGQLSATDDLPLEEYQGHYRCYATNALGTAVTPAVHIIVEAQPVLLKHQKVHKRAFEGESMVLACNPPESSTPPHIHWMDKKMVHIRMSQRVVVGVDGNLYFANLLKSDSRDDYVCNAQYAAARTILPNNLVSLTVLPSNDVAHGKRPHLFRPSGSHTSVLALRGHSLTLECIPKGLPTPTVQWEKKDSRLSETGAQLENFDRWLSFETVEQSDDGEYECRCSNSHGDVKHSFTVTVEAAPHWVKQPKNLLYAPGETVMLECHAEGIPTPTLTWTRNGRPINELEGGGRLQVLGGVLKLTDVEFADTAVYQCQASNKHGAILLNTHLYVIELPPQILSSDGVVYRATEGGDVLLYCESFGSPRPHVTWEGEDGVSLLVEARVSLQTDGTLQLSNVSVEDAGAFICLLERSNLSITAHLEVYNRTRILRGPQHVSALRGDDTLLHCLFSTDLRLNKVQVQWRRDAHKIAESSPDDKYTIFENGTLKVTNVEPEDTAAYSCEVITDLDHVEASGSVTVVAPPDPPKALTLSDVDDYTLTLSWIPGDSHNSPVRAFVVESSEEQHSGEHPRWEQVKEVPGDFSHLQLSLLPFCTYRFRVIALNHIGASQPSAPSDRRSTPPAVPHSNPTNVRSESTEPGTLLISWDEMPPSLHGGQDFQYKVSWRESGSRGVHWNSAFSRTAPLQVNGTGTFMPFEIKVQAVNALGEGPPPQAEVGHSGEDVPEGPPGEVSVAVSNSSIMVSWREAERVRGLLRGYRIYIHRLGPQEGRGRRSLAEPATHGGGRGASEGRLEHAKDKDSGRTLMVTVNGAKTSQEVSGLRLFSRYQLYVTAFNSKGEGPPSTHVAFTTPEGAPGPPASLTLDSPTESSLILTWTPPIETNGVLLGYVLQYHQGNSPVQIQPISDPTVTSFTLDALDPNSYYTFQVNARTAAGDGPPIIRRGATLLDGVPPVHINVTTGNTHINLSWVPAERQRNHVFRVDYEWRKAWVSERKSSEPINSTQAFHSLTGLQPGTQYKLTIQYANDTYWEELTETKRPFPEEVRGNFAAQGWLIGLISAIVLLVLILLILCLIKRSKGGKYAVKDKEDKEVDSEARPMKDETFGEYSDGDEKRSESQPSLCGESQAGSEDSLAEYGDSVDIQFNEDGSFIGQYSGRGPAPHGNESSGPASPDANATSSASASAPPPPLPPLAPSMSAILNRPT